MWCALAIALYPGIMYIFTCMNGTISSMSILNLPGRPSTMLRRTDGAWIAIPKHTKIGQRKKATPALEAQLAQAREDGGWRPMPKIQTPGYVLHASKPDGHIVGHMASPFCEDAGGHHVIMLVRRCAAFLAETFLSSSCTCETRYALKAFWDKRVYS
jgi:hypothetical protein